MGRFAFAAVLALAMLVPPPAAAIDTNPFDTLVPLARVGDPMPAGTFTDQNGDHVAFADQRGNVLVVAFVYTKCRDACPIITRKLGAVLALLGDGPFRLVEVTIDPVHDTRTAIAAYAREYGMRAPQWRILTGAPAQIDGFDRRLGVQSIASGGDTIIHSDRIVLVSLSGDIDAFVDGESWTPADLAAQMRALGGEHASWLARVDLAMGAALAYCGGAISGRAGIGDLLASLGVIAMLIGTFVWIVRRTMTASA